MPSVHLQLGSIPAKQSSSTASSSSSSSPSAVAVAASTSSSLVSVSASSCCSNSNSFLIAAVSGASAAAAISSLSPQLLRFGDIPISSTSFLHTHHTVNNNDDNKSRKSDSTIISTTTTMTNSGAGSGSGSGAADGSGSGSSSTTTTIISSSNSPSPSPPPLCHNLQCMANSRSLAFRPDSVLALRQVAAVAASSSSFIGDDHDLGDGGDNPDPDEDDEEEIWPADSSWPALDVYACDDFRMFEFKVRKCVRGRSHDWTECPFSHPGEKARRRDPRRYHYSGTACPDFRKGNCRRGDACEYAHGVFECWLHPARYRTQPCKDGRNCRRRVCFFAHTPEQLRVVPSDTDSPPTTPRSGSGTNGSNSSSTARASLLKVAALSGGAYDGSPLRRALAGSLDGKVALDLFLDDSSCKNASPLPSGLHHYHHHHHHHHPNCNWVASSPSSTLIGLSAVCSSPSPSSSPVMSPTSPSLSSASTWPVIPSHRRHLDRLRSLPTVSIPSFEEACMSPLPRQANSPNKMAEIMNALHNLHLASSASIQSCRDVRTSVSAWPLLSQLQNIQSQSAPTTPQSRYCYGMASNLGMEVGRSEGYPTHKLSTTRMGHGGVSVECLVTTTVGTTAATCGETETPDLAWVNELVQ